MITVKKAPQPIRVTKIQPAPQKMDALTETMFSAAPPKNPLYAQRPKDNAFAAQAYDNQRKYPLLAANTPATDPMERATEAKAQSQKQLLTQYTGKTYQDTFLGQFGASKAMGRLNQEQAKIWNEYLNAPTAENLAAARRLDAMAEEFQKNNTETLAPDATAPLLSQSLAGYLPQLWDQTKAQVGGGLAGALAGSAIPVAGTALGAKAGMVAASGAYSYATMRGTAFRSLLSMGVEEETARKAANDEAILSSLIEMADTGVDLALLGGGKLLNLLGKGGVKELAKKGAGAAAENAGKKVVTALAKYGINVAGEAAQEGAQEAISIANERRTQNGTTGKLNLAGGAFGVGRDALLGGNTEAAARMENAAREGAKIAAMMGGATAAINTAADIHLTKNQRGQAAFGAAEEKSSQGLEPFTEQEQENLLSNTKNKIAGVSTGIRDFVKNAAAQKGNDSRLYLGKIPQKVVQLVLEKTGQNIERFGAIMNGTEAWHALKNHANVTAEAARGQIALTEDDFELIPDILSSPDDIQLSKDRDSFGRPALIFTKKIGDKYVTIQGYSKGKQGLVFDSMWKIKRKPPVTANIDSTANQGQTSKTGAGTASTLNIALPFEKSKGDGTDALLDLKGGADRDTLNPTDARVQKALALKLNGATPSQINRETGLIIMANGNLLDGIDGPIIWRDSGGQDGRSFENYERFSEKRSGAVHGQGGLGTDRDGGESFARSGAPAARRSWESLTGQQQQAVTQTMKAHVGDSFETRLLVDGMGGMDAFSKRFYQLYQQGDAVAETWSGFLPDVDGLTAQLDDVLGTDGIGAAEEPFVKPAIIKKPDPAVVREIVIRDNANRYYLHEAVDSDGNLIYGQEKSPASASDRSAKNNPQNTVAGTELFTERDVGPVANAERVNIDRGTITPSRNTVSQAIGNSKGETASGVLLTKDGVKLVGTADVEEPLIKPTIIKKPDVVQKNTASGMETVENSRLTDADAAAYFQIGEREHVRNLKKEMNRNGDIPILSTRSKIMEFIQDSAIGKIQNVIKAYGLVGKRFQSDVAAKSRGTTDISGYYLELDSNRISHLSDHLNEDGDERNIPLSQEQLISVPDYIDNYDDLLNVVTRKDGQTRIYLGKKINGHSVIIVLASKGRKSIQPVTAWQNTTEQYMKKYGKKMDTTVTSQNPTEAGNERGYHPAPMNSVTPPSENSKGNDRRIKKDSGSEPFKTGMTAKSGMTGVQNQLSTHNVSQAIGNSKGEVASGVLLTKDGVKLGGTMRQRGTGALDKLGVRPVGDMGKYDNADFLRGANQAKKNSKRELQKALARLDPTPGEREFSRGIANGLYAEANIPPNMSVDTVTELADYYRADSSYNQESGIEIRKASIREQTEQKAAELFKDAERYKPISMLVMNERTPERIMRSVFGMERGDAINQEYIYPVQSNEAKKMRFLNRMMNTVRTFTDSNGERSALTQPERAITQQLLEDRFVGESVASMETAGAIRSAAENIKNGKDSADEAREFGLGAEERGLAEQLARWMKNQELLQSGALDSVKLNNAVEKYAGQFDLFYDAVNDFLVAHGYDAIGFIKGYAPHMQGVDTQNRLLSALKSMGVNTDASSLPTSISGLTADYKPGKRWNPFFQSRVGTKTDYDIAKAYESYVGYMADVLYHTDDIARLRAVSRYLRKTYGSEELFHAIDHAESLRHTSLETQLEVLRDAKKISAGTTLSWEDTKAQMDSYIDELYEDVQHMQKYGELVKYIDNYANILAGKQSMADRGMEYTAGRTGLNAGNKLVAAFARAQVAGNVSSVLNQAAQLPMILSEVDGKYIRSAAAELAQKTGGKLWNIKKTELFDQSDLLTSKMGIEYLTADDTAADRLATTLFKPADIMDGLISALAVQSKYDQLIADGKNHEVAMTEANRFATGIMASRAKGSRPLAFESKSLVSQMLHMFQVEALNGWEHLSQDLPTQYQETARQYGKKAGARAVAMVATKGLLAAFLMNRITEAAYGGTPAPFDILGFISNFIASGKGMSTNAWLENLVNAGWQALFGTPLFGAGDDEDKEKKPFVWKRAFGDLGYNIMNEVPFARNATGLLGLGDQSMPLANIADSVKGVGQAVKNAGIFSDEMGGAMLDLGSQLLPGGRQLQKTAQGIQTLANSGRVYGYGDKKRLQYPVEKTPGNIAQALLFGNSGLSESRDFYASGDSGFTAKQTGLLRDMTQAGGDIVTLYQAVQEIRKEESTKDKMRTLDEAKLSDEEKLKIYAGVIATSESKRPEIFRELMEKQKFSWNQVSEAYTLYLELNNADMAATEKATRFSRWADETGLSSTQRATLKDALPFYSQARAEATRYSQLVEGGLKPNVAEALALRLSGLQPKRGKETVSDLQRYQAVAEYGLSEKTQMAALESLMVDKEYEKIESLYRSGISPKKYFAFEEEAAKLVSDKDRNGKTVSGSRKRKVLAAMNAMDLTTGQKDALYYAEGYAKSTLHDAPWYVHVERLDEALPAPRLAGPILVKPTLTRDIMPKLTK